MPAAFCFVEFDSRPGRHLYRDVTVIVLTPDFLLRDPFHLRNGERQPERNPSPRARRARRRAVPPSIRARPARAIHVLISCPPEPASTLISSWVYAVNLARSPEIKVLRNFLSKGMLIFPCFASPGQWDRPPVAMRATRFSDPSSFFRETAQRRSIVWASASVASGY